MTLERCTVDAGVPLIQNKGILMVLKILYYALQATVFSIAILGKAVQLFLPSGLVITIIDENMEIPNFPAQFEKKYWAVKVTVNIDGVDHVRTIPLVKRPIKDIIADALFPITGMQIPGSENWLFVDEATGTVLPGTECNPPQYYTPISLSEDLFPFALVLFIFYALIKLNLVKTASNFITRIMTGFRTARMQHSIKSIEDRIDDIDRQIPEDLIEDIDFIKERAGRIKLI